MELDYYWKLFELIKGYRYKSRLLSIGYNVAYHFKKIILCFLKFLKSFLNFLPPKILYDNIVFCLLLLEFSLLLLYFIFVCRPVLLHSTLDFLLFACLPREPLKLWLLLLVFCLAYPCGHLFIILASFELFAVG